jgi:hypothetical protein
MDRRNYTTRLEALSNRLRVAVGAACVERVLPIFEAITEREAGCEALRRAVAVAWRYAEGAGVHQEELDAVSASMREHAQGEDHEEEADEEGYDRDRTGTIEFTVCEVLLAVKNLIMAVDERDPVPGIRAGDAARAARQAVFLLEKYDDKTNDWALLEDEWQEAILVLAERSRDPVAVRASSGTCVWRAYLEAEW